MAEVNNIVRQEAAARIISECREWLNQLIGEEKQAEQKADRRIAELKQTVGQISNRLRETN